MTVLTKIRPKEPLKYLKWYDILIVTIIMFGGVLSFDPRNNFYRVYSR